MSLMDDRELFVKNIIKDKDSRILEIGPLNRPIVLKSEYKNSLYCDIRSTEEIKKLYAGNEYLEKTGISIDINSIVEVDYVLNKSYQNTFSHMEKFDYVVASHVLEHMQDIIGFFQDISGIMKPGGKLCIIYPDKRYCFDHFRESASFRDAYDVFTRGRTETARMVLDFFSMSVNENNPVFYWKGKNLKEIIPLNNFDQSIKNYKRALNGEKLDDVHYWPFTDRSFLLFMYNCIRAKLIPFTCSQFIPTKENTQQFFVELVHDRSVMEDNLPELRKLQNLIASIPEDYYNSENIRKDKTISQLNKKISDLISQNEQHKSLISALTLQISDLEKANTDLKKANNELTNQNTELINANKELSNQNNALINTNKELTVQHSALLDMIHEFTIKNASMEDKAAELTRELELIRQEKNYIIKKLEDVQNQLKTALSTLDEIYNSKAWKATKTVRLMLDSIKRIFKIKQKHHCYH